MKKVIVTGGTGKAECATIAELKQHGYEVRNVDRAGQRSGSLLFADLSDYGQTVDALAGYEVLLQKIGD